MTYKQDHTRRTRNVELGIKATQEEREQLLAVCRELGISRIEFLIRAMNNYKEVVK